MARQPGSLAHPRNRKRVVLAILVFMVLANIVARYPLDNAIPHGSDSLFILDLSRELESDGQARWTLSPLSYAGLYPLSYPSGVPFLCSETQIMTGVEWNALPCITGVMFATAVVLAAFMLLRTFRINGELSALLSGLMGFTPLLMTLTFQQASSRAALMPIYILGLAVIFWHGGGSRERAILFILLSFCMLSMHRASLFILLFEGLVCAIVFLGPWLRARSDVIRRPSYLAGICLAVAFAFWPYVPGLRWLFGSISEFSTSFDLGKIEFSSGFLFDGTSPFVLAVNLGTNYVGSVGLLLLLLPVGLFILYPKKSRPMPSENAFLLISLIVFAPFVWKAQYIQLLIIPLASIFAGLVLQERRHFLVLTIERIGRIPRMSWLSRIIIAAFPSKTKVTAVLFVALFLFSSFMVWHRINLVNPITEEPAWPTPSEVNAGIYLSYVDSDGWDSFTSGSGDVDRHVRWISGWNTPVIDSTYLQASGYLSATRDIFQPVSDVRSDPIGFITTFYKTEKFFVLDPSTPDRDVYYLTLGGGVYGIVRIYYLDPGTAILDPRVSTAQAQMSVVIMLRTSGYMISDPWAIGETIESGFLKEVSESTYKLFCNDDYDMFLACRPSG